MIKHIIELAAWDVLETLIKFLVENALAKITKRKR